MLRALCNYYDCLRKQKGSGLVPDGYSYTKINYNMVLSLDGEIKAVLPYTEELIQGKKAKTVPREELFPKRNSSTTISAETIEHRAKYLFGCEHGKNGFETTKSSLLAFQKCKEKNETFLGGLHAPVAKAYLAFMQKWVPEEQLQNETLLSLGKNLNSATFVITLEGEENTPLNRNAEVMTAWEVQRNTTDDSDEVVGMCSITGEREPIARLHDNLMGVPGGQASGVNIVSFNNTAFESYGKQQSYNSSISETAMRKYTTAFNYLTSSKRHKEIVDDMTFLFWAQTEGEEAYLDLFSWGAFDRKNDVPDREEIDRGLLTAFRDIAKGNSSVAQTLELDEDIQFYILGLKPNASRLSVKLFEKNSFGKILKNLAQHHADMSFSETDKPLSIYGIVRNLKSPNSSTETVNTDLATELLKSILCGYPYPTHLLNTAVRRAKVDQDDKKNHFYSVNFDRVRIIKACLTRRNYIKNKGEYDMLNETSKDTAYNLGRLFALLEKVQTEALGDINATIKDKFFSSACTTPYLVFPRLLRLAQPHLKKIDNLYREKQLQEIMGTLGNEFPKTLNTEKQGMFVLGYYQQKQKFYEKHTAE